MALRDRQVAVCGIKGRLSLITGHKVRLRSNCVILSRLDMTEWRW